MLALEAGDYHLTIEPERGGSIASFDWKGQPLLRPTCGPSIFDVACFPLVPFSNRIAEGRFIAGDRLVRIAPNFPGAYHSHPLHGFGWLAPWSATACSATECVLEHRYDGNEWPWPYIARQSFSLTSGGLALTLVLENHGATPMPSGIGFHPYFPRDEDTQYLGLHRGEWHTRADGLPRALDERECPLDWWDGKPVATRIVDTVYTGREGFLTVRWPKRGRELRLHPSDNLTFTTVYVPKDADFFCVEPVSQMTNAVNQQSEVSGLMNLAPGESMNASLRLTASRLQ